MKPKLLEADQMARKFKQNFDEDKGYPDDSLNEALKNSENLCERILYKAIYSNWLNQQAYNFNLILLVLCQVRGLSSIFELLKMEREKIFSKYYEVQGRKTLNPSHCW